MTTENEQKKTLLIIKSQMGVLIEVESFLQNRDWRIFSTTNLKDALSFLVKHQPAFVMISVDHPNKKVRNLAKVLNHALPCCVMLFAEKNSAPSFQALGEARIDYILYPTVTGPAVERMVNKYYKDKAAKQLAAMEKAARGEEPVQEQTINIKGGGVNTLSLLTQLMNEDVAAAEHIASEAAAQSGDRGSFIPGSETAPPLSAKESGNPHVGHYNPQVQGKKPVSTPHIPTGSFGSVHTPHLPEAEGSKKMDPFQQHGQSHHGAVDRREESDTDLLERPRPGPESLDDDMPFMPSGTSGNAQQARASSSLQSSPLPLSQQAKQSSTQSQQYGYSQEPSSSDSIILKGTVEALERSVVKNTASQNFETIKTSSNVACLALQSTRFAGYLVTAMGKNKKVDQDFIESVRGKLFRFLKERGEVVDEAEKNMQLQITPVPFEDWALEYAEFLRKSVHKGDEVAMAFFPRTEIKATLQESADKDMVAVSLDDLQPDVAVHFNLYLYLPTNNKYILYTPQGSKLYGNQKEKLSRQGVFQMHMNRHDIEDFDKYRAENYLNSKIAEYEDRRKL